VGSNGTKMRERGWYQAIFNPGERFKGSEVYRSAIRHPKANTPRGRAMTSFQNFFLHIYPVKVPRKVLPFRSTFRLGFIVTVLFTILFVSGMYLMFFYIPSVDRAYQDILSIENSVAFGSLIRNMHRWGAHLMVLTVFLHMMRVFYHGAYKPPREWNWAVGVFLLFCTLWLSFTGYLLPWDQIAFWAVTVGTNMAAATPFLGSEGPFHTILNVTANNDARFLLLGDTKVGASALLRFYVLHCVGFPLIAGALMVVHFWRVRKDGGISRPL